MDAKSDLLSQTQIEQQHIRQTRLCKCKLKTFDYIIRASFDLIGRELARGQLSTNRILSVEMKTITTNPTTGILGAAGWIMLKNGFRNMSGFFRPQFSL